MSPHNLNVFINCPFDKEYIPFFDAILFTVYKCGFRPRCAYEFDDGGQVRIEKINRIIEECCCGIHDISRTEPDKKTRLPRFNMPFELGLFLGAKRFGSKLQKSKVSLILDRDPHRYQQFISDISGQDVKSHDNDIKKLIKCIRDVLHALKINDAIPGPQVILDNYMEFKATQPDLMKQRGLDLDDISYADKVSLVERWLNFMLLDKLGAHYILIKGGTFTYSLTNKPETVTDLYMAKYAVTNSRYWQFINYLSGKGAFIEVLSTEIFRQKLLAHANTIHETGFYDYLQGESDLAERFRSVYEKDDRFNKDHQPVVGVSWYAAKAYCYWLSCLEAGCMDAGLYRLPTEIEWEYTAGGKERRPYPWGSSYPTQQRANYKMSKKEATTPVGVYPDGATPDGLYDMAGNVWEWMDNMNEKENEPFFLRGGSWDTTQDYLRCSVQGFQSPFYSSSEIGFRVVRSGSPS